MNVKQLRQLRPKLDALFDSFAADFGSLSQQQQARAYLQGLLLQGERRNVENIAEAMRDTNVRSLQHFLSHAAWSDDIVLAKLRQQVNLVVGDPQAILTINETGFPKQGNHSVGVSRQYSGCLGKTDNCQIGVFLHYKAPCGQTFLDRRLYLPDEWLKAPKRCRDAGVPDKVVFRSKPDLAVEMVQQVVGENLPFAFVTADSVYGDSPTFVRSLRLMDRIYVADVSSNAHVWWKEPKVVKSKRGRFQVAEKPVRVSEVLGNLSQKDWNRWLIGEGSKGPRLYDYASRRVWFSEEGLPGVPEWLLVRRSLDQRAEIKYHRSNATATTSAEELAKVRGFHWWVEGSFERAKGECGLAEYEVRNWRGWHHHTALSMTALWCLESLREELGEKRA